MALNIIDMPCPVGRASGIAPVEHRFRAQRAL